MAGYTNTAPQGATMDPISRPLDVPESSKAVELREFSESMSNPDSGYASAVNTPKPASRENTEAAPDQAHPGSTTSPTIRSTASYPLSTSSNLKVFKIKVNEAAWTRYRDISERIQGPLLQHVTKSSHCHRPMAMRMVVLGETEKDAKPRIVVLCHKDVQKKVKKFFSQPDIIAICRPGDPFLQDFDVEVIARSPQLKTTEPALQVEIGLQESQSIIMTLCGAAIRIKSGTNSRSTTLGGMIAVTQLDGTSDFYGMVAGHVVEELLVSEVPDVTEEVGDNEKDMESDLGKDDGAFLDSPTWSLPESCLDPAVTNKPGEGSSSWLQVGHTVSIKALNYGPYLDWALISIDSLDICKPNSIRRGEGSVSSGDLVEISSKYDNILDELEVIMITARGQKRGLLSVRPSYAFLGTGTDFTETYLLTLDNDAEILDGDSGSWIVEEITGGVFGHLVAADSFGDGYVVPLHASFADIRSRMGAATVSLPTTVDITSHILRKLSKRATATFPTVSGLEDLSSLGLPYSPKTDEEPRESSPTRNADSGYVSVQASPFSPVLRKRREDTLSELVSSSSPVLETEDKNTNESMNNDYQRISDREIVAAKEPHTNQSKSVLEPMKMKQTTDQVEERALNYAEPIEEHSNERNAWCTVEYGQVSFDKGLVKPRDRDRTRLRSTWTSCLIFICALYSIVTLVFWTILAEERASWIQSTNLSPVRADSLRQFVEPQNDWVGVADLVTSYDDLPIQIKAGETAMAEWIATVKYSDLPRRDRDLLVREMQHFAMAADGIAYALIGFNRLVGATVDRVQNVNYQSLTTLQSLQRASSWPAILAPAFGDIGFFSLLQNMAHQIFTNVVQRRKEKGKELRLRFMHETKESLDQIHSLMIRNLEIYRDLLELEHRLNNIVDVAWCELGQLNFETRQPLSSRWGALGSNNFAAQQSDSKVPLLNSMMHSMMQTHSYIAKAILIHWKLDKDLTRLYEAIAKINREQDVAILPKPDTIQAAIDRLDTARKA